MGEASNTATGLLLGILKLLLTIGGVGLGIFGLVTSNWTVVGIGIGLLVLGQVVHALDQRLLDALLARWAAEAVAGVGPVPPRPVRMSLMRLVTQSVGLDGDRKLGFQMACRDWASEQKAIQ